MPHHDPLKDDELEELDIERDRLRLREARTLAIEIVRDEGWTEKDEDYEFQIEMESRKQWSEIWKQEEKAKGRWEDLI